MSAVRVTWHGADRDRPGTFKVIVSNGSVAVHHGRLTEAERDALLASPTLAKAGKSTPPAIAAGAALLAEVLS